MKNKPLKVGFDLDGVILNNPLRVLRLIAKKLKVIKPLLFKQKKEPFFIPKTSLEKFLWRLLHFSSYKVDPAFHEIKKLVKNKKIRAYLITARFNFLKSDFQYWVKKINRSKTFTLCLMNNDNEQPDIFKKKMIQKLKLDYFVEDNYDIVEKLNNNKTAKILWITNFFDKKIPYRWKFASLKEVCQYLKYKVI